jgi:hypothetical protein
MSYFPSDSADRNEYGCPTVIRMMMELRETQLLKAVRKLGPERVQWVSDTPHTHDYGGNSLVHWTLDGAPATEKDLCLAAGIEDNNGRRYGEKPEDQKKRHQE